MKPRWRFVCAVAFQLTVASTAWSATITWDGSGGMLSWQTATNWSGNVLPSANDDVVLNVGSNLAITSSASVTIRSLQCTNHLAFVGGTFRVTSGSSVVQGQLVTSGNPALSAIGALTSFTVIGSVMPDGMGFEAAGGATLSLPQMSAYSKGAGCVPVSWQATGAGSVLDFPGLATITGAACASLNVQALGGGKVVLTILTTVNDGVLFFLADGTNSLMDLGTLQQVLVANRAVSFEARHDGTVWAPLLTGGPPVS